jgi:hypothetical protein
MPRVDLHGCTIPADVGNGQKPIVFPHVDLVQQLQLWLSDPDVINNCTFTPIPGPSMEHTAGRVFQQSPLFSFDRLVCVDGGASVYLGDDISLSADRVGQLSALQIIAGELHAVVRLYQPAAAEGKRARAEFAAAAGGSRIVLTDEEVVVHCNAVGGLAVVLTPAEQERRREQKSLPDVYYVCEHYLCRPGADLKPVASAPQLPGRVLGRLKDPPADKRELPVRKIFLDIYIDGFAGLGR